jgi:hypothetical protein
MAHSAPNFFYFEDFWMNSHIQTVFNQFQNHFKKILKKKKKKKKKFSLIKNIFRGKSFHCPMLAPQDSLGFHPCKSPRLKILSDLSVMSSNTCIQCRESVSLWHRSLGFRFAVSPSPSLTIGLFLSDVVNMRKSAQPSDKV